MSLQNGQQTEIPPNGFISQAFKICSNESVDLKTLTYLIDHYNPFNQDRNLASQTIHLSFVHERHNRNANDRFIAVLFYSQSFLQRTAEWKPLKAKFYLYFVLFLMSDMSRLNHRLSSNKWRFGRRNKVFRKKSLRTALLAFSYTKISCFLAVDRTACRGKTRQVTKRSTVLLCCPGYVIWFSHYCIHT